MDPDAPAAIRLDLLPRRWLKGVRVDRQVLDSELVLLVTPDLDPSVPGPIDLLHTQPTEEEVVVVHLIPAHALVQDRQLYVCVWLRLHTIHLLLSQLGQPSSKWNLAALEPGVHV